MNSSKKNEALRNQQEYERMTPISFPFLSNMEVKEIIDQTLKKAAQQALHTNTQTVK